VQLEDLNELSGRKITSIVLGQSGDYSVLRLSIGDNLFDIYDSKRSCCERRYMTTDDGLDEYVGATFLSIELREATEEWVDDEFDMMDSHSSAIQFLVIITDRGNISFANHNEHNGYYGGFEIVINKVI